MSETNFIPQIEPAPPYTPMIEPPPPETKIALLLAGQPTNSMATGNPKKYPTVESAAPYDPPKIESSNDSPGSGSSDSSSSSSSSESSSSSSSESSSSSSSESSSSSSSESSSSSSDNSKSKKSGISIASIVEAAGNINGVANVASAITSTVLSAVTEKCTSIISEYSDKLSTLPTSISDKIENYTEERLNKTINDVDEFGKKFDPIKKTVSDYLTNFTNNIEYTLEETKEKTSETLKNNIIDNAKKTAQQSINKANTIVEKGTEAMNKIISHTAEGTEWLQKNIDKQFQLIENSVTQELKKGYENAETNINEYSKSEGYRRAVEEIEKHNALMEQQAKQIENEKKKLISKAEIKSDALVQKTKLQLASIIGYE